MAVDGALGPDVHDGRMKNRAATPRSSRSRRASATRFADREAARDRADPRERRVGRPRPATSGSNSSATACWRWPSPRCCSRPSRRRPRASLRRGLTALVRNETLRRGGGGARRRRRIAARLAARRRPARRDKAAILGDVCEAVIGAIYLDGGIDAARTFVGAQLAGAHAGRGRARMRDAKTTLQEWAQGKGFGTPAYAIVGRHGPDHAPRFDVEVTVGDAAAGARRGAYAARRGAARPRRCCVARRRVEGRAMMRLTDRSRRAAASSRSSARPMPASRRWSTGWSAPRSRSSATRCRRRGRLVRGIAMVGPSRRSSSSTRRASSRRSAGSTGRWSRRPGAARATPTSWRC